MHSNNRISKKIQGQTTVWYRQTCLLMYLYFCISAAADSYYTQICQEYYYVKVPYVIQGQNEREIPSLHPWGTKSKQVPTINKQLVGVKDQDWGKIPFVNLYNKC